MRDNPGNHWLRWVVRRGQCGSRGAFWRGGSGSSFGPRVHEQAGQRRRPLYLHARLNHRGEGAGAARDIRGEQRGEVKREAGPV